MSDQFTNAVVQVAQLPDVDVQRSDAQFQVNGVDVAPLGEDGLPAFVTIQYLETKIADKVHFTLPDSHTVICHLKMKSGATVIGEAHATEKTFDERKCAEIALNEAMGKLFDKEQYALADRRAALAGLVS